MNRLLNAGVVIVLTLCGAGVAAPAKHAKSTAPANGVKTPGVQIPYAQLVAEAQVEIADVAWLAVVDRSLWAATADRLIKVDTKTNKPLDPIDGLHKPCGGVVSAFGFLWSPQCGNGTLARIDPKTSKITATIESGVAHQSQVIAASQDSIWLLTDAKATLARIDPEQGVVVGEIRLPAGCSSIAFAEKSIWVGCGASNKVLRFNASTNIQEESIAVSAEPVALTPGAERTVWVFCRKEGKLDRIDTKTNKVAKTVELKVAGADGAAMAIADGWLWLTMKGFPLTRIDPKQDAVVQQFYGDGVDGGAFAPGALWLRLAGGAGVARIDPKRVLATLSTE